MDVGALISCGAQVHEVRADSVTKTPYGISTVIIHSLLYMSKITGAMPAEGAR